MRKIQLVIKRIFDIVFSMVALIVFFPFILVVGIMIKIVSPESPVIFRQTRAGKDGKVFKIIKLRSMTNERGPDGELLSDADRLKKWGVLLRKSCIDELPSFWNVLVGDMSIVGPRPLLMAYNDSYTDEQKRRLEMKPGLACLQQAIGTNQTDWGTRFKYDIWYIDHFSLWTDMRLFVLTVRKVLVRPFIKGDELAIGKFERNDKVN
jgi:lipopolysaccharide/colanic/teichoic acid biosynthesis glycosyltransferase